MKSLQSEIKAGLFRPSFASQYTFKKADYLKAKDRLRLGDLLLRIVPHDAPNFCHPCEPDEFEVVDLECQEKGYFSIPPGPSNPDYITGLIEAHFDSPALRLSQTLWMV